MTFETYCYGIVRRYLIKLILNEVDYRLLQKEWEAKTMVVEAIKAPINHPPRRL